MISSIPKITIDTYNEWLGYIICFIAWAFLMTFLIVVIPAALLYFSFWLTLKDTEVGDYIETTVSASLEGLIIRYFGDQANQKNDNAELCSEAKKEERKDNIKVSKNKKYKRKK